MANEENEKLTYQVKMATILVNVAFPAIARAGRPLDIVTAEAEKYADGAIELRQEIREGSGIKVVSTAVERRPITGWARTTVFIRMAAWWFRDHFPRFTPEFTASHFPVVDCRVVRTEALVEATSKDAACKAVRDGLVVRYAADRTKLGEFEFFCRRAGRGFKV